ncbi:MAG: serine hydroxymethyltransferase [Kiritimatiellae bacterium]|nr:serine hydroxymethyltransferase [Kiritimatiellia bacterium]
MKVIIGCDHGGLAVKEAVYKFLRERGDTVEDLGVRTSDSVDYPDIATPAAEAVIEGRANMAVLVCKTGEGMTIAANRFSGIRAALCSTPDIAGLARSHNDANVLALSGALAPVDAVKIVEAFVTTVFSGEERHARRLEKVERGGRVAEFAYLASADRAVYDAIKGQLQQEDTTINLIASENTTSRAVREAAGSVLTNKYAEGYPGHRWYSGCLPVDAVEQLAIDRAKQLFGAEHANVQPHCGSSANMAVYLAVLNPGDTILSMSLDQGGHLSHGSPVNFSGKLYNIVPYCVSKETEMLDYEALEQQALACKPRLILAGASAYPRTLDFERFRAIADKVGAYLMVDMAHIAGLVAGGAHPSPVPYADFVTTTTHKTLRGPRGGLVLCREQYAKALDKAVFPGMQGGPLENIIAAKAICFAEAMTPAFKAYAQGIVANCKALADVLEARGFHLVSGGTDNHLMLVNVARSGLTGKAAAAALDAAGIICNKNAIPFDTNSPFVTSGIRIGTASVTTRGMGVAEMQRIGGWIADILADVENTELQQKVRGEVAQLVANFPVP